MMPLCHLFSMLLIKAKKLYNQQKIKSLTTKTNNQQLFSKGESHLDESTPFSFTYDEIIIILVALHA